MTRFSVLMLVTLLSAGQAFASTNYTCVNKLIPSDVAELSLAEGAKGTDRIHGAIFGESPKYLWTMEPQYYPLKVTRGHVLASVNDLGDGVSKFVYVDRPEHAGASFTLDVIEDNQKTPKKKISRIAYSCNAKE